MFYRNYCKTIRPKSFSLAASPRALEEERENRYIEEFKSLFLGGFPHIKHIIICFSKLSQKYTSVTQSGLHTRECRLLPAPDLLIYQFTVQGRHICAAEKHLHFAATHSQKLLKEKCTVSRRKKKQCTWQTLLIQHLLSCFKQTKNSRRLNKNVQPRWLKPKLLNFLSPFSAHCSHKLAQLM